MTPDDRPRRRIRIYVEDALGMICLGITIYAAWWILPAIFGGYTP